MKKLVLILGIFVINLLVCCGVMASTVSASERTWCFSNSEFDNVKGKLSSEVTVNGLTMGVGVDEHRGKRKIRNIVFSNSYYTLENGSTSEGYFKFSVSGDTDIHILGGSKNVLQNRSLTVYSSGNNSYGTISMKEVDDYKYEYRGPAGDIYLYTAGNGVRLFSITAKDYNASEYAQLNSGEKTVWDFGNYASNYSNITNNITIDGLNLFATQTKSMSIGAHTKYSIYGCVGTGYLDLSGTGMYEGRYITFKVPKNSDVFIMARSGNDTESRKLIVGNKYFGIPNTNITNRGFDEGEDVEAAYIDVTGDLNTYKISYYGDGEDFMLYSADSTLRIYKIMVAPRTSATVEEKEWNFSSNSAFAVGQYNNSSVEGLTITKGEVVSCNTNGYTKAMKIRSNTTARAGMLKFNISDSWGTRGDNVARTISVTASTELEGIKLVLVNSEDYLIGSAELSSEPEVYTFNYTGGYDEIRVFTFNNVSNSVNGNSYIYRLDNGVAGATGPNDYEKVISVVKDASYQYYFTAENVNANKLKYKITYNADALTPTYIGYGDGSNNYSKDGLNIISNSNGVIEYTIDKNYTKWSGVTVSVIFKAKSTGNTTISYIAEVIG